MFTFSFEQIIWWWYSECRVKCMFITMLGWLVKIRSIQLEEFSKICVSSPINCLRRHMDIRESNCAPSEVVGSSTDQFVEFALKSPVIKARCGFRLDLSTISSFKLNIKLIGSLSRGPVQWYHISFFITYTHFQNKMYF